MKKSYIDPRDLPPVNPVTFRRIAAYLRPYRLRLVAIGFIIATCAVLNLLPPLLIKTVVDHAIPEKRLTWLLWLCAGMIAGPLAAGLLQVAQKYLAAQTSERVMLDLRLQLFRHFTQLPLGWFAAARPGEALSRVLNDVQGVGSMMSSTVVAVLENTIVLTSAAATLLYLDWRLALLALAVLPLFVIPTRRVGAARKHLRRQAQQRTAEMTGMLSETLSVSGALLLQVFGAERFESDRLERTATDIMNVSLKQTLTGRWFQMLLGLFENVGPALIFAAGGWLVIRGDIGLGTIVAFVTVLRKLYQPASQLAGVHVDLVTSYAYFERVFSVLDIAPAIVDKPGAVTLNNVRGALEFRDVSFTYGGRDTTALSHVSFTIAPGETVAVVGASGSGKSTLAALVPRLYDPETGAVTLDGHDLRDVTIASLRSQIAVVLQDTYLFHGSMRDNLRYARPEATDDEMRAAVTAAQLDALVASLPQGLDTLVGDRGYQLSGGERQRVAIARALLRNPRILILDEATSALDGANEAQILAALQPLRRGRTSLVIAHRLSTVLDADRIVLMEKGRVLAAGTHTELLASSVEYAVLFQRQHRQ